MTSFKKRKIIFLILNEILLLAFDTSLLLQKNLLNSQHTSTNSKGYFVLKKWFKMVVLAFPDTQKLIKPKFGMAN